MKKLFLIILLIITSVVSSCRSDDFIEEIQISQDTIQDSDEVSVKIEKYMDQNSPGVSVQGASCYGDYLFQFQHANAAVYIYNLKKKEFVFKVELEAKSQNHCNNVSFSNVFYEEDDEFPLLYVSGSQSGTYNHIQVYRISRIDSCFLFEEIQDITFPEGNETNHMFWTQVMIDDGSNFMYVLSKTQNNGGTYISKFQLPPFNFSNVYLVEDDILEQYEVLDSVHKQGAVVYNSFLYIMYGVPARGDTNYLRIIDLVNKKDYMNVNITEIGSNQEFEGLTVYKDKLIATTNHNAGIFSISFYDKL